LVLIVIDCNVACRSLPSLNLVVCCLISFWQLIIYFPFVSFQFGDQDGGPGRSIIARGEARDGQAARVTEPVRPGAAGHMAA
jgi:hypothetical protein